MKRRTKPTQPSKQKKVSTAARKTALPIAPPHPLAAMSWQGNWQAGAWQGNWQAGAWQGDWQAEAPWDQEHWSSGKKGGKYSYTNGSEAEGWGVLSSSHPPKQPHRWQKLGSAHKGGKAKDSPGRKSRQEMSPEERQLANLEDRKRVKKSKTAINEARSSEDVGWAEPKLNDGLFYYPRAHRLKRKSPHELRKSCRGLFVKWKEMFLEQRRQKNTPKP